MIQLEHAYTKLFTSTVEGVGTAADSTPSAVLYRNGSASGVTVTVSTTGVTGLYKATFTTLASGDGWAELDHLELYATATIDSTSGYLALVWSSLEFANATAPLDATATQSAAAAAITAASLSLEATSQSILEDTGTTLPASLTAISNSIAAINAGAARYIAILTPAGYEIPDAGSVTVPIEIRTYDADGEPVDLDAAADPAVAIYRASDGTDLSAALSALSNPATGVWRLTYTVTSADAVEPLRVDASGAIDSTSRSTSAYPVVTDAVAVDFTGTDRGKLDAIAAKLPSTDYLLGTSEGDGSGYATSTAVAAVKADTATLLDRITAAAATLFVDLAAMITGSGSDPKYTTAALENGASGEGGGGLTGPYVRTITVTDGDTSDPIELAKVRLYKAGSTGTLETDASGEVEFATEAATWSYSITAGGYSGATGSIVISGDGTTEVSLSAASPAAPSNPDMSTLVVLCLDNNGDPEEGVEIDSRIQSIPSGDTNIAYLGAKKTTESDSDGLATIYAVKGAVYGVKRGDSKEWQDVTIGEGEATNVTSFIGSP